MRGAAASIDVSMPAADETQIYRDLLRFKPENLTPNAWAVRAGVSRAVWADMRRHGNPSRRTLEKLLAVAGSSLAEFEALRVGKEPQSAQSTSQAFQSPSSPWLPARLPPLPLIAASLVGEWGEAGSSIALMRVREAQIIDRIARPASLANDAGAYAITVVGESMWPRFRAGRKIAVSRNSAVALGDDVLLFLQAASAEPAADDGALAVIGELARRTNDCVELRQFNPPRSFSVDAAALAAIHKVAGELI